MSKGCTYRLRHSKLDFYEKNQVHMQIKRGLLMTMGVLGESQGLANSREERLHVCGS
jgi:hypothetical protein